MISMFCYRYERIYLLYLIAFQEVTFPLNLGLHITSCWQIRKGGKVKEKKDKRKVSMLVDIIGFLWIIIIICLIYYLLHGLSKDLDLAKDYIVPTCEFFSLLFSDLFELPNMLFMIYAWLTISVSVGLLYPWWWSMQTTL